MNGVDLARFEFDYDTTWQAFFLDANLNVYSRYGGRDEKSADGRHSVASLQHTMNEVLVAHERRRRPESRSDADLQPAPRSKTTPEDIPLLKAGHQGCVHCHQIAEYRALQSFHDGKFSRDSIFGFPLPDNVGINFDLAHGHRVDAVVPESPAAKGGLAPGDVVTRVDDVPVRSEQDFRWALHRVVEKRSVVVTALRAAGSKPSQPVSIKLDFHADWRKTDLGWRKSLRSVPLPLGFLGYALGREERRTAKLPDGRLAIKVVSLRGGGLAGNLGLEKGDLIVSLAGRSDERTLDDFKSDLLRRYAPGDKVRLTVLRDGKSLELTGPFPPWDTTDTSVP